MRGEMARLRHQKHCARGGACCGSVTAGSVVQAVLFKSWVESCKDKGEVHMPWGLSVLVAVAELFKMFCTFALAQLTYKWWKFLATLSAISTTG